jgi:hypothetical protein
MRSAGLRHSPLAPPFSAKIKPNAPRPRPGRTRQILARQHPRPLRESPLQKAMFGGWAWLLHGRVPHPSEARVGVFNRPEGSSFRPPSPTKVIFNFPPIRPTIQPCRGASVVINTQAIFTSSPSVVIVANPTSAPQPHALDSSLRSKRHAIVTSSMFSAMSLCRNTSISWSPNRRRTAFNSYAGIEAIRLASSGQRRTLLANALLRLQCPHGAQAY